MQTKIIRRVAAAAMFVGFTSAAQAHTGHGAHSLMEGLSHPFGADHLLAMVAVGIWSVACLPRDKAWQGPATFLLALIVGAVLGMLGVTLPYLEHGVALSIVLFGLMLIMATRPINSAVGLGLMAIASSLHGLAHGLETPDTGFVGYASGFLLTTAVLHMGGVGIGLSIKRWLGQRSGTALGGLGAALSASGVYLFNQLAA